MRILLFIFCIGLLSSCDNEQNRLRQEIEALEAAAEADPVDSNLRPLLENYNHYLTAYPKDIEWNSVYLYRAAQYYYRVNNFQEAISKLELAAKDFGDAKNNPNVLLLAGNVYDEFYPTTAGEKKAGAKFQAFIDKYPNHPQVDKAKFFFKPNHEKLLLTIDQKEKELYAGGKNAKLNTNKAMALYNLYMRFLSKFPEDEKQADFLFKAGEVANSVRLYPQAIKVWRVLFTDFPDHEKAPQATFLAAFAFEEGMKKSFKAKELYQQFLDKYPDHALAEAAKVSLDNLGKTAEEIVKGFQEKK